MKRAGATFLLGSFLAFAGWLYYTCAVNQDINFLTPGPASWIVYPMPPEAPPIVGLRLTTVFRRAFVLPQLPAAATISWRCFKSGQLILNGTNVASTDAARWKNTALVDAGKLLHSGTNEIEVRVSCGNALPALNLELEADGLVLKSDETWETSQAGAIWQSASLASETVAPARGNWLYDAENIQSALSQSWPLLLLFAAAASAALLLRTRLAFVFRRPRRAQTADAASTAISARGRTAVFVSLALALVVLVLHNLPLLPAMSGFDAAAHLGYIDFIQQHKALPRADQGWEFFQAPLYYVLGAGLLGLFHVDPMRPEAQQLLGVLNLLFAGAELTLIATALRQLFPQRRGIQIFGFLLAAFLPVQIYLLHYPTNEILGVLTTTAALCVCLKILRQENPGWRWFAGLGAVLGAALLSKASAIVAVGVVFAALAAKAWRRRQPATAFVRETGLCFGLCLLLGGWHYWKLWRQFGNPFIGNWDPAVGGSWWQLPGYRTPDYYLSFGQSLVRPFFSGFHSFWDGLYSTWWGDGLFGAATRLYGRTPWNYNLVTVGYVLALVPSLLALTGLCRALAEGIRRRQLDWLFLAAFALLFGLADFAMTLKIAYYSQSRSIYGLPAILPFCAFGALGLEYWMERFKGARPFLLVWLGVWSLTVYASFWIRPDAVATRLSEAVGLYNVAGLDPAPAFERVLALDSQNAPAIVALAGFDKDGGHLDRAVARLEAASQIITNEMIDGALAMYLGEQGHLTEAVAVAKRACAMAPDFPTAPNVLCGLSLRTGQNEQAGWAGTLALRLKPQDEAIQFSVGLALVRLKRYAEAASYFANAIELSPRNADAHFWRGIALWNVPDRKAEGRNEIAAAVQLSPQNTKWKSTLVEIDHDHAK